MSEHAEEYTGSVAITGACGGIGVAISHRFASAGAAPDGKATTGAIQELEVWTFAG